MLTDQITLKERLSRLRKQLSQHKIDVFLIIDRFNTLYFSGFHCTNSITLVGEEQAYFLTDFRYIESAESSIGHMQVQRMAQNGADDLAALLKKLKPARIGFEGSITYSQYRMLEKAAGRARLLEQGETAATIRSVKEPGEIEAVAENQRLNERVLRSALKNVRKGVSEQRLRAAIRGEMNSLGVEEAFDTIVAFAANSSLPHATPGPATVRKGEFLLIDMGVRRNGYHSDMTRTYVWGEASAKHREIYRIVLEAQQRALEAIREGASCRDVDAAARSHIAEAGYSEFFGHGLGHGVGLEIHEGPTLNPRSEQVLAENMVVTVEPGIYIPGFGGVRIEDLVVVTRTGHRNLTSAPKRFRTLTID